MNAAQRLGYQLRVNALDALNHSSMAMFRTGAIFVLSKMLRRVRPEASLWWLAHAHLVLMYADPDARLSARLNRAVETDLIRAYARGGMVEFFASPAIDAQRALPPISKLAGIVLKAPRYESDRIVEKGLLLLKNTERIDSFRRRVAMDVLLKDYTLVLEPSWSGYANPRLLSFCVYRDHPIVVMSPCAADHRFLEHLDSNLLPISIGASDWVDPRVFRPLADQSKRFDAVMVARWTRVKRHHLLLRALVRIADPAFRVAIVASNIPGDTDRDAILALIDRYRLGGQVAVFEDLEARAVNEILNQSKVNLLLSRQEGSNRSLFEGFFAGVPGLAFANVIGVPVDHFSPQTGRLIGEHELAGALLFFRKHWEQFDPRPWAMANITPEVTTARLNQVLQQLAHERGDPWTRDIVCKSNRPEMHYYPDEHEDHGFATIDDLLARYGR